MKILVVDDEEIVLDSCRIVLEAEGFEVIQCTSADQSLAIIRTEDISLLLVDVKMPGRDGLYLLGEVKEKWPDIPVIVMSGYATNGTILNASKKGADTFVAKPFTPDELLNVIHQVIQGDVGHGKE